MNSETGSNLRAKWIIALVAIVCFTIDGLGDIRIKRRMRVGKMDQVTTTYLKGARQRNETRYGSAEAGKYFDIAWVEQCDLKQMMWIDLTNKRYALQTGGIPAAAVMAFNQPQLPGNPQQQKAAAAARKRGLLKVTTKVIDTGERREMFGFTARHLQTVTVWQASPKTCDSPSMTSKTDGWYVDLFYGIDCSPDLSGSVSQSYWNGSGKCFTEYAIKRRYAIEQDRVGPASLGYPLLETRTSYDDKGVAEVVTEEVLEVSRDPLEAALFDAPAGFTRVDLKTDNPSFFRRLFSFIGR